MGRRPRTCCCKPRTSSNRLLSVFHTRCKMPWSPLSNRVSPWARRRADPRFQGGVQLSRNPFLKQTEFRAPPFSGVPKNRSLLSGLQGTGPGLKVLQLGCSPAAGEDKVGRMPAGWRKTGNPNRLNQLERPTALPTGFVLAPRYPGFDKSWARGQAKGSRAVFAFFTPHLSSQSSHLHSWRKSGHFPHFPRPFVLGWCRA